MNNICREQGECFARLGRKCTILNSAQGYGRDTCPFRKPEREVTNGRFYPYNPDYTKQ